MQHRIIEAAKSVCDTCTVTRECLQFAFEHDERFGVWGGMEAYERRQALANLGTPAAVVSAFTDENEAFREA